MKIAIVGASGALGSILTERLALSGHDVSALSRSSTSALGPVDVLETPSETLISQFDALIYLAWATRDRSTSAQTAHVNAARVWARNCQKHGVKMYFASTVLASESSKSRYGFFKHQAELAVLSENAVPLRIGLVIDDASNLMATRIRRACAKLPSLSRLLYWPVFPLSATDLTNAFLSILENDVQSGTRWLAPNSPVDLAKIAAWPDSPRRPSRIFQPVLKTLLTRKRGFLQSNQLFDGLVGMVNTSNTQPEMAVIRDFEVDSDGWTKDLRASQ